MKVYVEPSVEIRKLDVEDVIAASSVEGDGEFGGGDGFS